VKRVPRGVAGVSTTSRDPSVDLLQSLKKGVADPHSVPMGTLSFWRSSWKRGRAPRRMSASRRGVLSIAVATGLGQLVTVASAPIISRIYTPASVGALAVVLALALPLGSITALRLEAAIPIADTDEQAFSLVWLAAVAITLSTTLIATLTFILSHGLASLLSVAHSSEWLALIPVLAGLAGTVLLLSQLAIRQRRYGDVGRRSVLQSTTTTVGQVLAGIGLTGPIGLLIGYLGGQLAGVIGLTRNAGLLRASARRGLRPKKLALVALRYRRFPILFAPAGLLNSAGLQLPVLLLAHFYGAPEAGWFGMSQRILALPVSLMAVAVAQVYLGELARTVRSSPTLALALFDKSSRTLLLIGVALAVLITIAAQPLFPLVLGHEWVVSGDYARAIAIGLGAQVIASPLASTLTVLERGGTQLVCDLSRVLGMIAVVAWVRSSGGSALTAVWLLTAVTTLFYTAYWALSRLALRRLVITQRKLQ
jgi:O-antigen/teichoic acid export membrane protein